jgi:hypothetical protein
MSAGEQVAVEAAGRLGLFRAVAAFFKRAVRLGGQDAGTDLTAELGRARTSEDLYAFGSKTAPRPPRPVQDFGVPSPDEPVGPFVPGPPTDAVPGASTFTDPKQAPLTGNYHSLPADTPLPPGLGIHADGQDAGGTAPWGHRTVYPSTRMTVSQFQELFSNLPWTWAGKK